MVIKIDFKRCVKAGECYYNHPELFKMAESGFPEIAVRTPSTPQQKREASEAVEVCPSGAISYESE